MSDSEKLTKVFCFNDEKLNWAVLGEQGGIHVWCSPCDFSSGGIEIHSKSPLYEGSRPHGDVNCWLIGCQCHHDGSSLQWTEYWSRMASMFVFNEHQSAWWNLIAGEYSSRFDVKAYVDFEDRPRAIEAINKERMLAAVAGM